MRDQRMNRCAWAGSDPLMQAYHDAEWGVPERDSRALWEKLMLDGFQAGLAWITVLQASARRSAPLSPGSIPPGSPASARRRSQRLLDNPGIIRSRAKIEATIGAARLYCEMAARGEDFGGLLLVVHRRRGGERRRPQPSRHDPALRDRLEGTEAPRLQVRRPDHRLCLAAGGRHRQRPCARLASAARRSGGADDHALRHQELRHRQEGPRLARRARHRLRFPRL